MTVNVIIERISASLAACELPAKPENVQVDLLSMADLLRPFDQVFPGLCIDDEDRRDIFGYGGLLKPRLVPQVRRSVRPLLPPKPLAAPSRFITPGLFISVQAIWDWYRQEDVAVGEMIDRELNEKGLEKFLDPLYQRAQEYWPLFIPIENLWWDEGLLQLPGVCLMLPHYHAEDEGAGVVEAFLTGASGIEWLMCHYYGIKDFLTLPTEDRELIDKRGFGDICRLYYDKGDGAYDLQQLQSFGETFFGSVWEKFPEHEKLDPPIISGEAGLDADVMIRKAEDIDFCFAYAKAFYELADCLPDTNAFEENDLGETETFVHELCEVWRVNYGSPSVPWTSPAAKEITV